MCCTREFPTLDTVVEGSTPAQRVALLPTEIPLTWVGVEGSPTTILTLDFVVRRESILYEVGELCGIGLGCLNALIMILDVSLQSTDGALAGIISGNFSESLTYPSFVFGGTFVVTDVDDAFAEQAYVDLDGEPVLPEVVAFELHLDPDTYELMRFDLVDYDGYGTLEVEGSEVARRPDCETGGGGEVGGRGLSDWESSMATRSWSQDPHSSKTDSQRVMKTVVAVVGRSGGPPDPSRGC